MENTRQVLQFKINCSAQEMNEQLNQYFKVNHFIQTDYNGERVLKLNSLYAKQSFYQTYLKVYLSEDEIIVVGWINYKGVEYGFEDKLDFEDLSFSGNWQYTKHLYSIFFTIAYNYKIDDNVYCEKVLATEINPFKDNNLFVISLPYTLNISYSKPIGLDLFALILYFSVLMLSFLENVWLMYVIPLILSFFALICVRKNVEKDQFSKILYIVNICFIIVCIVSGVVNFLAHI